MAKHWIQGAIKNKGALRRTLGAKSGHKLTINQLHSAAQKGGKTGERARLALELRGFRR